MIIVNKREVTIMNKDFTIEMKIFDKNYNALLCTLKKWERNKNIEGFVVFPKEKTIKIFCYPWSCIFLTGACVLGKKYNYHGIILELIVKMPN